MKSTPIEKSPLQLSAKQLEADPGLWLPCLTERIQEKRWFAEKDAVIDTIAAEDTFRLASENGQIAAGLIALFRLTRSSGEKIIKRYFIPAVLSPEDMSEIPPDDKLILNLRDGMRYLFFAEHAPVFQKAFLHQYCKSGMIRTSAGGTVCFRSFGDALSRTENMQIKVCPLSMKFPSSNVLTMIQTEGPAMVSKTYKDMRGRSGQEDTIWLPNREAERYKALSAGNYSNIPHLYGYAYYQSPRGDQAPVNILMEAVSAEGQVGEVFAALLTRMLNDLRKVSPEKYPQIYQSYGPAVRAFARETAKTIAQMHAGFLAAGHPGFRPEPVSADDFSRWCNKMQDDFEQAVSGLKSRCKEYPHAPVLYDLTCRMEHFGADILPQILTRIRAFEGVMKAQVHGDLHGDQGFIRRSGDRRKTDEFLDSVQKGTDLEIQELASQLAANICWSDFEGPPAKTLVQRDYDARDILLADLGGMIQGFWYMLNVIIYENHENHENHEIHEIREIHEKQREISLSLGGLYSGDESGLSGELIRVMNLWLRDVTDAFMNGYFDETEAQNTQSAILKEWDRGAAAVLIRYQILARAIHELRYETYSRNWGWEAIPGTRILNFCV